MKDITPELLRTLLSYEPETGKLIWLHRPVELFKTEIASLTWNARFAGKDALTTKDRDGYRVGEIFGRRAASHRVIWAIVHGEWPACEIDHINGIKSDNRLANLRNVSMHENQKNKKLPVTSTSGHVGVHRERESGKWKAHIKINQRRIYLGRYNSCEQAVEARTAAEKKYGFHSNHGRVLDARLPGERT